MEHTAVFEEQVPLTPKDMRQEITSIDAILGQKLQAKLEGRCSRNGFVLPNSVKILSRSMGMVEKGRFTGNLLFHVQAEAQVLNPPDGLVVTGEVIRKNKMGIYVNFMDAIRIIVPRDLNIGNDEFENVEVGESVKVEIKKSRFQVNDEYILSVGLFKGREGKGVVKPKAKASPAIAVAPLEELEEAEAEEEEEGAEETDAEVEEGAEEGEGKEAEDLEEEGEGEGKEAE
jgi:DNA-directed RNA polymerase subunit E'/Rpb7